MEDLDDRVRAAMQALDDRAPARFDEDYAAKVEARLATEVRMENMTTPTSEAPADGVPPSPPIDDSGLHDIKALAKTTRQRVSRRITSQHDLDESLLSSSSSGLHMVALPEPAKLVSLPSIAELAKAEPSIARAAEKVARTIDAKGQPRRSPAVWIAGAVVAAAAAAVGIIVVKGGGKGEHTVANSDAVGASRVAAPGPVQPKVAVSQTTPTPTPPQTATGAGSAALDMAAGSGSAEGSAVVVDLPAKDTTERGEGKLDAHGTKAGDKTKGGKTDVVKVKKQPDAGATGGNAKKDPNAPKSLDDLIDEAAGGPGGSGGGAKKAPTGDKPVLDKKELTPQDIRSAMGSVAKRAQACYDKFNQAGTVGVKASVTPSGAITKVTITGAFAGTPTGDCVANVVQNVSFPAWDGAPMTVNYSYLLTE